MKTNNITENHPKRSLSFAIAMALLIAFSGIAMAKDNQESPSNYEKKIMQVFVGLEEGDLTIEEAWDTLSSIIKDMEKVKLFHQNKELKQLFNMNHKLNKSIKEKSISKTQAFFKLIKVLDSYDKKEKNKDKNKDKNNDDDDDDPFQPIILSVLEGKISKSEGWDQMKELIDYLKTLEELKSHDDLKHLVALFDSFESQITEKSKTKPQAWDELIGILSAEDSDEEPFDKIMQDVLQGKLKKSQGWDSFKQMFTIASHMEEMEYEEEFQDISLTFFTIDDSVTAGKKTKEEAWDEFVALINGDEGDEDPFEKVFVDVTTGKLSKENGWNELKELIDYLSTYEEAIQDEEFENFAQLFYTIQDKVNDKEINQEEAWNEMMAIFHSMDNSN